MKIIRPKAVIEATGLSRTTIWRLERKGAFPQRLRLGPNSTGWLEADIKQWIESRPRGLSVSIGEQEFE